LRVWGIEVGVWSSGFEVRGHSQSVRVQGLVFSVQCSVFSVQGSGFRVQDSFRVRGVGCGLKVWVSGFRVQGSEVRGVWDVG